MQGWNEDDDGVVVENDGDWGYAENGGAWNPVDCVNTFEKPHVIFWPFWPLWLFKKVRKLIN